MIGHETIGVEFEVESLDHVFDRVDEASIVSIVAKDATPFVAAGRDVVDGARKKNPDWTSHD